MVAATSSVPFFVHLDISFYFILFYFQAFNCLCDLLIIFAKQLRNSGMHLKFLL